MIPLLTSTHQLMQTPVFYVLLGFISLFSLVTPQTLSSVLASNELLTTLSSQLSPAAFNVINQLENITLLAPSNDAFAVFLDSAIGKQAINDNTSDLYNAILYYHVLEGINYLNDGSPQFVSTRLTETTYTNVTDGQTVEIERENGSKLIRSGLDQTASIITANLTFDGGVVHIIDQVMTMPATISTTGESLDLTASVGASAHAGVLSAINYAQDITAFFPSNNAFRLVASALTSMTTSELANVLKYHVVASKSTVQYYSGGNKGWAFGRNGTLETLGGGTISIVTLQDGSTYVNNAKVLSSNHLVANGVVHVIDNVLNPSNASATPDTAVSSGLPAFADATPASTNNIPFTSYAPKPTATPSSTPVSSTGNSSSSGLSSGAKAGIGVGVALACIGILMVIFFFVRRSRKGRQLSAATTTVDAEVGKAELGGFLAKHEMASPVDEKRRELNSSAKAELDNKEVGTGATELDGRSVKAELPGNESVPVELDSTPVNGEAMRG